MADKTMRVIAHDQTRVTDQAAPWRYIGRVCTDAEGDVWPSTGLPVEVPAPPARFSDYYVRAVRDGDLLAADADTARVCGVPAPVAATPAPAHAFKPSSAASPAATE